MSLSKFARVQTDSEDDELQLFPPTRQRNKLRGVGTRRKVTFSSAVLRKPAKIVLVISIRVCAGYRGGYNRDASSHSDYVILVRKEQHLYYNVVTAAI